MVNVLFSKFVIIFVFVSGSSISEDCGAGFSEDFLLGSVFVEFGDWLLLLILLLLLLLFFSLSLSGCLVGGAGADMAVEKPDRASFLDCHVISRR